MTHFSQSTQFVFLLLLFFCFLSIFNVNSLDCKEYITFSSLIVTVHSPCGFSSQNSTLAKGHLARPSLELSNGLLANRREVVP